MVLDVCPIRYYLLIFEVFVNFFKFQNSNIVVAANSQGIIKVTVLNASIKTILNAKISLNLVILSFCR